MPNVEELAATVAALPDSPAATTVYIMDNGELHVSAGLMSLDSGSRIVSHRISQGLVPDTAFCMSSGEGVVGELPVPVLAMDDSKGEQRFDEALAQACSDLWMARNRLLIAQGQCPESRLAKRTFPGVLCEANVSQTQALNAQNQIRLQNIRARETYLGCSVDETFGRLYEAVRGSMPLPGGSAIAATTSAGYVNVRSGPSTQGFNVVDRLEPEMLVQVRSRVLNPLGTHRWVEIEYEGPDGQTRSGYVYYTNLEVRERRVNLVGQFEDFPSVVCKRDAIDSALNAQILDQIDLDQARETARIMRDTGPNFAGSAQLFTWGCGTGCAAAGVLDYATGVWLELPFVITRDFDSDEPLYDYRPDSTLLIARGFMNEDREGPFQYHWTGYGLQILSDPRRSGSGRPMPSFEASLKRADKAKDLHAALRAYRQAAVLASSRTQRATVLEGLAETALALNESGLAQAYAQTLLSVNPQNHWLRQHRDLLAHSETCLSRPMSAEPVDVLGHVLSN